MTNAVLDAPAVPSAIAVDPTPPVRRITPNLFAVSFGLAGLAQAWMTAAHLGPVPVAVADVLWILDAAVWMTTLVAYLRSLTRGRRWRSELDDHVYGPFVSVPAIVGMLLAGGLAPHARTAGLTLYFLSLVVVLVLAGRLLGGWILDDVPSAQWHPAYFLPSVGAPLVAAGEAATLGFPALAKLLFGLGAISWLLIGGILLHHLVGQSRLPRPLIPTMAIMLAPPVVAGNAWFAINGGHGDSIALALAGYAVLMVTVQIALVPAYRQVPFGPGWWSFSFPYAATTSYALTWLTAADVAARTLWIAALLTVITAFVTYLAARTIRALVRHTFLP